MSNEENNTKDPGEAFEQIKDEILNNAERLSPHDKITFSCHPGVACFNKCCHDINIILTPYDILRLKTHLGISADEFLAQYALVMPVTTERRLPIPVMRMSEEGDLPCQFLGEKGCTVYEHRPWACRMYPLGVASQKTAANPNGEEFFYLLKEDKCKGHEGAQTITIQEYMDTQGVADYEEGNEGFKELTLNPFFDTEMTFPTKQVQMLYMACYNLDMFRRFVFNSSFFDRLIIDEELVEGIKEDDEKLLRFAFEWLKFSLFGEGSIRVKPEALAQKRDEIVEDMKKRS